jgi:hypothetical protein
MVDDQWQRLAIPFQEILMKTTFRIIAPHPNAMFASPSDQAQRMIVY